MAKALDYRPIKVLCAFTAAADVYADVVLAKPGQDAPPQGAIPMVQLGGPQDGLFMSYVSVEKQPGGGTLLRAHGPQPHPAPVKGCLGCA